MQLCVIVCVLLSAGLVVGHVYNIPTMSVTTPDNSSCPSDGYMDALRSVLLGRINKVLSNRLGCVGSGWRRVAYLEMTDPGQTCPTAWRLYEQDSVRACGRQESDGASCNSVQFSTEGHPYTRVCGRVTGYQYASPDAGSHLSHTSSVAEAINEPYLDGVSITYGIPRRHIWSLYASVNGVKCCRQGHLDNIVSLGFIGNNSFCDTGNPTNGPWRKTLFSDHPLWDGTTHCPDSDTCCTRHSGPWFHTSLPLPTMADIEVRICGNQNTVNEDTPLELVELYIKK